MSVRASNRHIYGSYEYEEQVIPSVPATIPSRALSRTAYDQWAISSGVTTTTKAELVKQIAHVDFETFQKSLRGCVTNFLQKNTTPYVALVQPNKSQAWVTGIAMSFGLNPIAAIKLGHEGANELERSLNILALENEDLFFRVKDIRHVVIADDGSFSGTQMYNNVSNASRLFHSQCEFHIILPYATKAAKDKLQTLTPGKVYLYTNNEMPVVSDFRYLQKEYDRLGIPVGKENNLALTYFDHKIPNSMSFPYYLAVAGFIPDHPTPYSEQHNN